MPWGAVAAVVGAGLSYKASKDAADSAGDAAALEHEYRMRQLDLQEEGLDFSKEQYLKHEARWDPVIDKLLLEYDDYEPDFDSIAGDVNSAFDSARGQVIRQNQRFGIRPDDGLSQQFELEHAHDRALAHVGARNQARRGAEEIRYSRLADLYSVGQGIQGNSASALSGAYANSAAGFGNAANAANSSMRYYDQLAGANAAGIGQSLASVDWGGVMDRVRGWFSNSSGGTSTGGNRGYTMGGW